MLRRPVIDFFLLCIIFSYTLGLGTPSPVYADLDTHIKVYVNNQPINFPDQGPLLDTETNRVYVPVRFLSEALGAKVDWDEATKTVTIAREQTITLQIDSKEAQINGQQEISLDAPPILLNSRTLVPLRFLSEALGDSVSWQSGSVYIQDQGFLGAPNPVSGFVQLPAAGPGFERYSNADRTWGKPEVIRMMMVIGQQWHQLHPDVPPLSIGDISAPQGGGFPPHVSHAEGRDVDIGVMLDSKENYSSTLTQEMVDLLWATKQVEIIFYNDSQVKGVTYWPGHDDHLHIRFLKDF